MPIQCGNGTAVIFLAKSIAVYRCGNIIYLKCLLTELYRSVRTAQSRVIHGNSYVDNGIKLCALRHITLNLGIGDMRLYKRIFNMYRFIAR